MKMRRKGEKEEKITRGEEKEEKKGRANYLAGETDKYIIIYNTRNNAGIVLTKQCFYKSRSIRLIWARESGKASGRRERID